MDGEARKRANLRVLQRLDKHTLDIIGLATHVVLYQFRTQDNQWEKCNVEGSLFVTKRSEAPRFKMIVLNRNSTQNLEVGIHSSFQMQLREPYLIFRDVVLDSGSENGSGGKEAKIRGLWFHDGDERNSMFALLQKVVQSATHVAELEKSAQQPFVTTQPPPSSSLQSRSSASQSQPQQLLQQQRSDAAAALLGALNIKSQPTKAPPTSYAAAASVSSPMAAPVQAPVKSPPAIPQPSPAPPVPAIPSASTSAPPTRQPQPTPTPSQTSSQSQPVQQQHHHLNHKKIVFDKKSLQLSLLSLIQDDRFLDLIHAQYLKVAHARATRDAAHQQNHSHSNQNAQPPSQQQQHHPK